MRARSVLIALWAVALAVSCGGSDRPVDGGSSPQSPEAPQDTGGAGGGSAGGSGTTDSGGPGTVDSGGAGTSDSGGSGTIDTGGSGTSGTGGSATGDSGGSGGTDTGGSGTGGSGTGNDDGSGTGDNGGGTTPPAGTYTIVDLGTLGGVVSRAIDVNAARQVVGQAATTAGDLHAFLWTDGTMEDLGTLGGRESVAFAINAGGVAVGSAQTASGAWHAVMWESGAATDLGTLPDGAQSFAYGINDVGSVVGASELPSDGYTGYTGLVTQHAMLWERAASGMAATDLGTLGGGFGRAVAINASGRIAGITYRLGGSGKVFSGAVSWTADEGAVDLETQPGDWASDAYGIDSGGAVVGVAYAPTSTPTARPVRWDASGVVDLGTLGATGTVAFEANDAGRVVGTAGVSTQLSAPLDGPYYGETAVTWSPGGPAVALDTLLFDGAGWRLRIARGINAEGAIVGTGEHGGARHAFLLVPH